MARVLLAMTTAAALWGAASASADSWLAPTEQDYYSADEAYYFRVFPGNGATHARGTLYEAARREGDDREVWSRELLNPSAPHRVLVADSGQYVVTFDEWGRVGYGPNVVVIYGPEGDVIKKYALEDIMTDEEIAAVPTTVSSRWWGSLYHLDEDEGVLSFKAGRLDEMVAVTGPGREVRIRLSDGEVLP